MRVDRWIKMPETSPLDSEVPCYGTITPVYYCSPKEESWFQCCLGFFRR